MEITNQVHKRILNQVRNFEKLLTQYSPETPLSKFLQEYFRAHKYMGSKDRKNATRFAFHYFRIGLIGSDLNVLDRLLIGEFLCSSESELLEHLKPEWNSLISKGIQEKVQFIEKELGIDFQSLFPYHEGISTLIDKNAFLYNILSQPLFFIRVKKGAMHKVQNILSKQGINYSQKSENCLVLPHQTALDKIPELKGWVEVQDYSSQQTLNDIQPEDYSSWWDVCSGSGGKSLLLIDKNPKIKLLATDIRPSILKNLDKRFETAHVLDYHTQVLDVSKDDQKSLGNTSFDGIICDVPCSGSGTWGRSPENMLYFNDERISEFSSLQKKILRNSYSYLKEGKTLVYITCSVFHQENEDVINELKEELGFKILNMRYFEGATHQADTLFVAYLKK